MRLLTIALGALIACSGSAPGGGDDIAGDDTGGDDAPPVDPSFRIELTPATGVGGTQRINFAVPLPRGLVDAADADAVTIAIADGAEVAAARRAIAAWPDGSLRSIQIQVEVDVDVVSALDVVVGATPGAGALELVPVADTLTTADGTQGPRVWVVLPAEWLAATEVGGPMATAAAMAGTELDAWGALCDYATWDTDAFLAESSDRGAWLYDRPTAMYRGYVATGDLVPLRSAYREAAIYRAGITGTEHSTRIGVPTADSDVKYHYTQGLALHYLLTGDDRFRESAEHVAIRMRDLWTDPHYDPGEFWTERNAGFSLLAYEWAAAVSDDRAAVFAGFADEAVDGYLAMLDDGSHAWETDARCFAHAAADHDEPFGYVGCSPWMSAILADGLDAYARRVDGADADAARAGLVRLGAMIARHGRDDDGRPYYWMGAGVDANEVDGYDEHWGEAAYVVALGWHWSGETDAALNAAAMELVGGLATRGEVGQLRSFNWQCRSAVMTPAFLQ